MAKLNKISEISKIISDCNSALCKFVESFKALKVPQIIGGMRLSKRSGMPILEIILEMFIYVLQQRSIHSGARSSVFKARGVKSQKNTFYNFASSGAVNFRKLLHRIALSCMLRAQKLTQGKGKKTFMVFDDTAIEKTGVKIEGVSKVHDHVGNNYIFGYKNLTATITDGEFNFVLDFALVGESKNDKFRGLKEEDYNKQFSKEREEGSESAKRHSELLEAKTDLCLKMLHYAFAAKICPDYILFDSWFSTPAFIKNVMDAASGKSHVICMLKKGNYKCTVNDTETNIKALVERNTCKEFRKSKSHKCKYLKIRCIYGGKEANMFLVRPAKGDNIFVILTTDTKLHFNKVFEHYHLRWSIEVTFRDCKQYTGLPSCQSRDLDSQICHATLSYLTYNILNYHRHIHERELTFDGLFADLHIEATSMTLWEQILKLVKQLLEAFCSFISIDIQEFMRNFISGNCANNPAIKGLVELLSINNQFVTNSDKQ